MAYDNFKSTIWSRHIQHQLPKFTVFEPDCNYTFQGEVGKGKTVKILGVNTPTIGDYTGASIGAPQIVTDSAMSLVIDQAKYFNFMVDDVDEAQAVDGLLNALLEEATRAMAMTRDSYIAKLCATGAGRLEDATITSKETAIAAIDAGLKTLWDNGVSQRDSVTIYLDPAVYMYLAEHVIKHDTDNQKLLQSGNLGNYMGAKVKLSNNLYKDAQDKVHLIIKTSKGVAFASGVDEVEAYRPETLFCDAIKGLNLFGGKVIRPDEVYAIRY